MTTHVICDGCGRSQPDGEKWTQMELSGSIAYALKIRDLCPDCLEDLEGSINAWKNTRREAWVEFQKQQRGNEWKFRRASEVPQQ